MSPQRHAKHNYHKFEKYINSKRDIHAYSLKPKYFKIIFPDNTFHITKYNGYQRYIGNAFESADKKIYAIIPNYGIPCNYRNPLPGFTVNIWMQNENGNMSSTRQRMNIEYIRIQRLFKK